MYHHAISATTWYSTQTCCQARIGFQMDVADCILKSTYITGRVAVALHDLCVAVP